MQGFVINANECLSRNTVAVCHSDYQGGGNWRTPGTIENLICTLKNDITPYPQYVLDGATAKLSTILAEDLPQILRAVQKKGIETLRVCVIPRAKHEAYYRDNQKLFRGTIQQTIKSLGGFEDGTHDIIRVVDTNTTHLTHTKAHRGITNESCTISNNVRGKNILLIDDLYTRTINIDEDAIQALYDNGAKNVIFYAIGRTIYRGC